MLEEEVTLQSEYVHVVPPKSLKRYAATRPFSGVLAPQPNKTAAAGVELSLAHAVARHPARRAARRCAAALTTSKRACYLRGAGDAQGAHPSLDPTLPKLRLEGVCSASTSGAAAG